MVASEVDGVRLHVSDRSATGYKGVYNNSKSPGHFSAEISVSGKTKRLGDKFGTAVEAAIAYAEAYAAAEAAAAKAAEAAKAKAAEAAKAKAALPCSPAKTRAKGTVTTYSPGRATWSTKPAAEPEKEGIVCG